MGLCVSNPVYLDHVSYKPNRQRLKLYSSSRQQHKNGIRIKIMDLKIGQILELTGTLIILYLVLTNSTGFAKIISSVTGGYTASVKALQGR